MSDIKLFMLKSGKAEEIPGRAVALEKSLQTLIERNLASLLGVRFLAEGSFGVRSWTMYMLLSEGNSGDRIQQLTSSLRQMQTLALLSRDLHGKGARSSCSKRSSRSKPHGSSKFKHSTFNDHTPLPIFRITSCSEAFSGWYESTAKEERLAEG
jgi:hypothetical protein